MTARAVDFWFDFASTYSYPAAMTIESQAAECGVAVRWRPFLLGPIFAEQGWADSPFNLQPAKGRYMWRDLERLCQAAGLPFRRPETFPQHSVAAARIMLHGLQAGWGPAFAKAIFAAEFAQGANIRDEATLADAVRSAGGMLPVRSRPTATTRSRLSYAPRSRRRAGSGSSARQRSWPARRCSGAMTGWRRRSTGLRRTPDSFLRQHAPHGQIALAGSAV